MGITFCKGSPSGRDTRGWLGSLVRDFERVMLSPWTTNDAGGRYPKLLFEHGSCICDPDWKCGGWCLPFWVRQAAHGEGG